VRGLTDLGGSLTGTADYDVFGEVRANSGASSLFGFSGEQLDTETGFTFLRARYLGPSGHQALGNPWTAGMATLMAYVIANPEFMVVLIAGCAAAAQAAIAGGPAVGVKSGVKSRVDSKGVRLPAGQPSLIASSPPYGPPA
jgi:hypothetical protein